MLDKERGVFFDDYWTGVKLEPNSDEEMVNINDKELSDDTSNLITVTIDSTKLHNIYGNSSYQVGDDRSGNFKKLMADLGVGHRLFSHLDPDFDDESTYANNGTHHIKYPSPNTQ